MTEGPANRLDAAVSKLEQTLKDRIDQPLRRLKHAIEYRRQRGGFNEAVIIYEVEMIEQRERAIRLSQSVHVVVSNEIDYLAAKLMEETP